MQLSGSHKEALDAYEEALKRSPGLALSLNGKGNALKGLGRILEARVCWREALELDPELVWARRSLERYGEGV